MKGGLIGLGIGVWFCFVFAVAYLVSPNGVSETFRRLFCIFMLYVPCRGSYSLVVAGVVGVLVWGVIGFLIALLTEKGSDGKFEKKEVKVGGDKGGVEVKSWGEKFGKKMVRGKSVGRKSVGRKSVSRKIKKVSRGAVKVEDFKKFGKQLDAKIEREKKRAEKEDAEIKKDLELSVKKGK